LERAHKNGKLAHAYLLYGPQQVGKLAMAQEFAKTLGCERVWLVDREHTLVSKKDERKEIPIEDIRELKRMWSFAPAGDAWRVLIINDAEYMSAEASNAFLKLLEEPGSRTIIFLVSSSRDLLVPTIVSRTIPISFSLVPDEILREYIEKSKIQVKSIDDLLILSGGQPGVLMELLAEQGVLLRENELLCDLEICLAAGRIPEAFRLSERIAPDREAVERLMTQLYGLLRRSLLSHIADGRYSSYIRSIKHLDRVAHMLDTSNAQTRLGLDALFLALQKR
jgi:DNA polymerase-3 subunit delta'